MQTCRRVVCACLWAVSVFKIRKRKRTRGGNGEGHTEGQCWNEKDAKLLKRRIVTKEDERPGGQSYLRRTFCHDMTFPNRIYKIKLPNYTQWKHRFAPITEPNQANVQAAGENNTFLPSFTFTQHPFMPFWHIPLPPLTNLVPVLNSFLLTANNFSYFSF